MTGLLLLLFLLVGAAGTVVVLTRQPERQALALSLYGLLMALLFFVLGAPDVAMSELVIGAAALPLMLLVALARVGKAARQAKEPSKET